MMIEKKMTEFLEELSSAAPVPGGGGASAAVGALAAALGLMVANLTAGKKKYAEAEEEICEVREQLQTLRQRLTELTDADAEAFEPLACAYRLPKATEEERLEKERVMERALYEASIVPLRIMETSLEVMRMLKVLEEKGSRLALSDTGVGILFAQAALEGASLNVFINTGMMKKREVAEELIHRADEMIRRGAALKAEVYTGVLSELR